MTIKDHININYRFDVIDGNTKIGCLVPVSNADITGEDTATIKTALRGDFIVPENFNAISNEIIPFVRINDDPETPCGVFIATTLSESYDKNRSVFSIEAYDRTYLLQRAKTESVLYYSAGTSYTAVFSDIMAAAGITAYFCDTLTATLTTARSDWEIGTDYLTILNQLLSEVGFNDAYADIYGVIQLRQYTAPTISNIAHSYKSDEYSIIASRCTITTDLHNKYNMFIARCDNPELTNGVLTATAENSSIACPFSTEFLPHIVAPVYNVDNVASQADLQSYINKIRDKSLLTGEAIEIQTAPETGHSVGETISISHERISGIYRETGWTLTLAGSSSFMSHRAERWLI